MKHLWSALYAASALASTLACGAIAWALYARADRLRASAVRFVIFCFFLYAWLWSLFRFVFFFAASVGAVYIRTEDGSDGSDSSDMDDLYLDALGTRGVAQSSEATSAWLSCVIVVGDAALMASSMWMLPMAWELTRLARRSMDRGADREARVSSRYNRWVHALTTLFLIGEGAYTFYNKGFDQQSTRILVSGNMIQALTLVYVAYAILELKFSGRKYEAVQGARVLSPLYKRIRSIMVVYGIFSFQYQVLSLVVLFSRDEMTVPTSLLGISTVLFTNTGTALSIFMGCSQECVVRSCGRFMPEEYVREFYATMDDNSHIHCATAPPMDKPVFVFTDIEASTQLWTEDPVVMRTALELHDDIIRSKLARHRGYEITTAGDAFQLAFHSIKDAVEYCFDVQLALLAASWPKKLHDMVPATKRKRSKTNKLVFSGLRVRMGVHDSAQDIEGGAALVTNRHPVTGKVTYTGLSEVIASEVGDVGVGGEICVTRAVAHWLAVNSAAMSMTFDVGFIARHSVPQVGASVDVFQVTPTALDARKKAFAKTRKKKQLEREKDKDKNEVRGRRERLEAIDVMEIAVVTV